MRRYCLACFCLWACLLGTVTVAQPQDTPQALQEVTVAAQRLVPRRLDEVIIPRFVRSHGVPSPASNQVARWRRPNTICASTEGLKAAAAEYVSRQVLSVAANVGAPTAIYGHCKPNVEIIFTDTPQAQVAYFGRTFRALLGYDGKSLKELLTFNHQIRAWYRTVTRTSNGGWSLDSDVPVFDPMNPSAGYRTNSLSYGSISPIRKGTESGFINVLVIVDATQVRGHSLDRKSTRLNSSHSRRSRMPSSA